MMHEQEYKKGYKQGFEEGKRIGMLDAAYKLVNSGLLTCQQVAKYLDMNEIELRAWLSLGFDGFQENEQKPGVSQSGQY